MMNLDELFALKFNPRTFNPKTRSITNRDFITLYLAIAPEIVKTRKDILTALHTWRGRDVQDALKSNHSSSYLSTTRYGGHAGEDYFAKPVMVHVGFSDRWDKEDERSYTLKFFWYRSARNAYSLTVWGQARAGELMAALGR